MAEATADFRNSISIPSQVTVMLSSLVLRVCALIITHDLQVLYEEVCTKPL